MFTRRLVLPEAATETFFLWGPRQTGKTTLLRQSYPGAFWVDLLKSDHLRRYGSRPHALREELLAQDEARSTQIVIDEVQKLPGLLDEVHWLIENEGLHFALCGSSARKVRRGAANLLGGRALRYQLHGVTAHELGREFDLVRLLNDGYLPRIYGAPRARQLLDAYVSDYLVEEIVAESLTRNLPAFADFLQAAALTDCELVNFASIARDCGVSSPTVKSYFGILEDTLLARWLPAWRRRPKRRVITAPKFYLADVGVVNRLARRGTVQPGSELFGKAFENWVFHELSAWIDYREVDAGLSYWRLASGIEVDFILGDMVTAIEAKSSERVTNDHLKGLRALAVEFPDVAHRIVVCREPRMRRTQDGIVVMPVETFVRRLWGDEIRATA